jgi:hypothetical protein
VHRKVLRSIVSMFLEGDNTLPVYRLAGLEYVLLVKKIS